MLCAGCMRSSEFLSYYLFEIKNKQGLISFFKKEFFMGLFEKTGSGLIKPPDDVAYHAMREIIKEAPYLEKLILRRDKIIDKLDEYPDSDFYELRKKDLVPILKQIEELQNNIRKNVGKITKEQYDRLPLEVQETVNLLDVKTS
jgi:hypothetical protein